MRGIFGDSFSVVRLSLKVIKICDSLFANKRKRFSFSSLPWKREAFLLSQTTSAYCVCNSFFFFHRWCFPRTIFNCPYNFLKLPNGLTGVTIFELSVGMLIILESCRTEILECNSQPSDTHRDTVYTGRGVVEKERNNGCFFENWLCFQMAQHSTSHLYVWLPWTT